MNKRKKKEEMNKEQTEMLLKNVVVLFVATLLVFLYIKVLFF
ncbi:hypothetical protein [Reichenbachiella ulvae]|uniref:Uncharacterized protein n=1 Tax=Reichenbachiella ulvae TaxID=2980104 RepID=A0ABT3CN70_9BACT|nr:hypothetical protein [Reichenbachiella ulvae]MCV9385034.1 hypothetical protein [Reichenbachiella ulvae]